MPAGWPVEEDSDETQGVVRRDPLSCIAIGASTGGLSALAAFFTALPIELATPILITQHLPVPFMNSFAEQLGKMAGRRARVAVDGLPLKPREIMLAPGDAHLGLLRTRGLIHARLLRAPAPSGARPSVDPMFQSAAQLFGGGLAGVVLSGMGRDGLIGAKALVAAGGVMLAQDEASSVVWGMPGAIVAEGLAEAALPPSKLAGWIGQWRTGSGESPWI